MCNSPSSVFGDKSMLSTLQKETYIYIYYQHFLHVCNLCICTNPPNIYQKLPNLYMYKYSNIPVIATVFLYKSYDFTMWLGQWWGQRYSTYKAAQNTEEIRTFLPPLPSIISSIHTPGPPSGRVLPKSVALKVILGEYSWGSNFANRGIL